MAPSPQPNPAVLYRVEGCLARVVLSRPKVRNAISRRMTHELDAAFDRACADTAVRCIVLTAEGESFSSGHDLGSQEQLEDLRENPYESGLFPEP